MVDGRTLVLLAMAWALGCGKSGREDENAEAGQAGDPQAGSAGSSGGGLGGGSGSGGTSAGSSGKSGGAGTAGGGMGGGTGGDAGGGNGGRAGASGGDAGRSGAGGEGGSAGTAGTQNAGTGGLTPIVDPVPPPDSSWDLPTGDPFNSTAPVLAAFGDAVVIAGATSDPELAGLEAFEAGIDSEAFVAALDREGQPLWSTALPDAGMPQAIAVAPDGDIVVVAANLPDAVFVSPGYYGDQTLIARLSPSGELRYARAVDFESGILSFAIDPGGDLYLAGGEIGPDGIDTANVLLARYDGEAAEVWLKRFVHVGSTAYAQGIAVRPNGDITITGTFNGSISFGGDTLTTLAMSDPFLMPNGFLARFDADGEHVRSERFGGEIFDGGTLLQSLANGDLLLGGYLSGSATLVGEDVEADADASAFLARLDEDDQVSWVSLAGTGYARVLAVDPGESLFHLAGDLGPDHWFVEFRADGSEVLNAPRPPNELFFTTGLAVDSGLGLWLSGGFMGSADFGNGNLLSTETAGVYLVRLERE